MIFRDHAPALAEMGYYVFPLRGKSEHILPNGCNGATNDLSQVERWAEQYPDANIGIKCENILVIDLDIGDGKDGARDLLEIAESLGALAFGPESITGGGGSHLFFRRPEVDVIGQTGVKWNGRKTGIDIRVGNQYIVAPPSIHPNGNAYQWARPIVPVEELPEIPQAWIDGFLKIRGSQPENIVVRDFPLEPSSDKNRIIERASRYLDAMPASISGQGGHNALFNAVGSLIWGFCLEPTQVKDLIVSRFNPRCVPPWNEREIDHKIQDSMNKPMDKPKGFLLGDDPPKMSWNEYHKRQGENKREPGSDQIPSDMKKPSKRKVIEYRRLSDMSRKELSFLWENRFLIGKPNLLAGHGGGTKSYFTCFMASVVSRGWDWPDGTPCPQGSTIIINCEDGAEDTILPRVEDCGGDLEKVFYVDAVRKVEPDGTVVSEGFTVQHVDELRDMIDELDDVRLVVLDPVTAFLDGIDDNKNGQLRAALRPLGELAEEKGFCLIYVTHLRKGASDNAVAADRVLGSVAYSNAARVTWFITNDPDDSELRIMSPGKGNNLRNPKGLSYRIIDNMVQLLDWNLDITADEALRTQTGFQRRDGRSEKPSAQKDAARDWLLEALADGYRFVGNPKSPEEGTLRYDAKQAGLSWSTVLRSSKDIGVVIEKEHFSKKYCWKLPEDFVEPEGEELPVQEVMEWQP